ncbi:MAG: MFS transporter [Dehalococcoidia bacterium]|nr:MFS transporter [Dehalococcoidia bacterium]
MSHRSANPGFFYGYIIVTAGFFVWLVGWGINQTFGVFYKPLLAEFGWGRAETVLAYSIVPLSQAFLSVGMGWLVDRLGPQKVVPIFGSFLGISFILMSRIDYLWQLYLLYALAAVGFSTASAPVMATIARWFVKRRTLMTGIVQAGVGLGGFIFAPFTGWLISNWSWRTGYQVLGIISLVGIIGAGLLLRRSPQDIGQLPDGAKEIPAPAEKGHGASQQTVGFSLREALKTRQFWIIGGIFFSFGFCRSTFLPHIAAHVQDLGFSLADGANVVAALTMSSILGRLWMGWLSNRTAFIISFAITALALGWGLIASDLRGLYLFAVVFGFAWGAQAVLRFTTAAEAFGLVSIGLIMGVFGFAEAGASAFGSYFGGFVYDTFGGYQVAFYMGIAISIAGIVLAWQLRPVSLTKKVSGTETG